MNDIIANGYLLDSNVIIGLLKKEQSIMEFVQQSSRDKMGIYFSVISVCEMYSGMKDNEQEIFKKWFTSKRCLDVNVDISVKAGMIRKQLRLKNRKLKTPDALIAATAINYDLTLVSRDSDFRNLQNFGLKLIDV